MFVVHFMSPADRFQINRICFAEYFESLMNKNIMNDEIGEAIKSNSQPDPEEGIKSSI